MMYWGKQSPELSHVEENYGSVNKHVLTYV